MTCSNSETIDHQTAPLRQRTPKREKNTYVIRSKGNISKAGLRGDLEIEGLKSGRERSSGAQ